MNQLLQKYVTTEGVLGVVGLVWSFLAWRGWAPPGIEVPAIAGFTQDFMIAPGHLFAVMFVPVALKMWKNGQMPFVGTTAAPPAAKTE